MRRFHAWPLGLLALFLLVSTVYLSKLKTELQIYHIEDAHFETAKRFQEVRSSFADPISFQLHWYKDEGEFSEIEVCRIEELMKGFKALKAQNKTLVSAVSSPLDIRIPDMGLMGLTFSRLIPLQCIRPSDRPVTLGPLYDFPLYLTPQSKRPIISYDLQLMAESARPADVNPAIIGTIFESAGKLASELKSTGVHIAGRGATPWHMQNVMKKDAPVLLAVMFFLLLFFRLFYGTWTSGLLLTGCLTVTIWLVLGAMSALNVPIDVLTNALFMLLIISGVEDYIFLLEERKQRPEVSIEHNFKHLLAPSFFTSLTTVMGFSVLVFSRIEIIRRFGAMAALAALIEWAIMLVALPKLMVLFPTLTDRWIRTDKAVDLPLIKKLANVRPSFRLSLALVLLSILGLFAYSHLNFDDSPRKNFGPSHPARESYDFLVSNFGIQGSLEVVFPVEAQPSKDLREKLLGINGIKKVQSLELLFEDTLAPFSTADADRIRTQVVASEFGKKFQNEKWRRWFVQVESVDQKFLNEVITKIQNLCGNQCFPSGELVVYADFANEIANTLFKGLDLALLLVGITVLVLCLWRKRPVIPVLVSLLWCPLMLLLLLVIFNVPVNLITCIIGAIFVGLAGDNSIQYLFAGKTIDDGAMERASSSVVLSLLSVGLCAFFLGFTIRPLHTVGLVLAAGFVLILIGDLWVLRGLLQRNFSTTTNTRDSTET